MRLIVPDGNRAGICSPLIRLRPIIDIMLIGLTHAPTCAR
jgi:hypothetical protein